MYIHITLCFLANGWCKFVRKITFFLSFLAGELGEGLLTIPSNEPIKMLLCRLLEHICDCQLMGRVEHVVNFAKEYVVQLQNDQQERAEGKESQSVKMMRELRTQTEKQVEGSSC